MSRNPTDSTETDAQDSPPTFEIKRTALQDHALGPLVTSEDGLNLKRQAAVEIGLYRTGGETAAAVSDVTISVRAIPDATKSNGYGPRPAPEEPLIAGTINHPAARFRQDPEAVAAVSSLTVANARHGRSIPPIKTDSHSPAADFAHTNAGSIGSAVETLATDCTNHLFTRIVLIPCGRRTVKQLERVAPTADEPPDDPPSPRSTDLTAVGITAFGKPAATPTSTAVRDDIERVLNTLSPTLASRAPHACTIVSLDPSTAVDTLTAPDLRPEPSGWPWIAAFLLRGKLMCQNPIPGMKRPLGSLPKLIVTNADREFFLGETGRQGSQR